MELPGGLDIGSLALFVGFAAAERVREGMAGEGYGDLRFSHGYVFQHLIEEEPAISELAARLEMTQQGASKVVAELEGRGYVERFPSPSDARVRRVRLTSRGRDAVAAARRIRAGQEEALAAEYGAERLAEARALLVGLLETLGGAEAVRRRSVSPP
ncbi:MarR family transcriptional regulator [Actinocorallia sp. B10E7]|uniref:MarR family winged helix-turn-helix transcriptional regulator n=1 Tax=Actinocorallia sp. B10E7 TaxID=3153558 RepID=UPI00325E6D60